MKITGLSNYKNVKTQVLTEYQQTLATHITEKLNSNPEVMQTVNRLRSWRTGRILVAVAMIIFAVLVFVSTSVSAFPIAVQGIFAALAAFAFLAAWRLHYLIITRSKNLESSVFDKAFSQLEIYKEYFEKKYENVKVIGVNDAPVHRSFCEAARGEGVPLKAIVDQYTDGFIFQINGFHFYTHTIRWLWKETVCVKGSCSEKKVYLTKFYITSNEWAQRWNGFSFTMAFSSLLLNKGKDLENDAFNKTFSYEHNDPVRLRILLTPFVQESFANVLPTIKGARFWEFGKADAFYYSAITSKRTPFVIDPKYGGVRNIPDLAKAMSDDLADDMSFVEEQLSIVTTFRELVQ